jgi:hypothetical protein
MGLEIRRDVRFFEFWSHEVCGTLLGIPAQRQYYVARGENGSGGKAWSQCFDTDPLKDEAEKAEITVK